MNVTTTMKSSAIVIAITTASAMALNASDITREVAERDRDKDGKPDFRVESYSRDGQRLMTVYSRWTAQGTWVVTSRAFHAGGAIVATESDKDQDGVFESLVVNHAGTDEMEGFSRQRDGSVQPQPRQALDASRKRKAAISDLVDKAISGSSVEPRGDESENKAAAKP
jgi:hypothetical protein